jgi:predicted ATPase/DNA-binding winged helix-turn-helix (wHTH) protein
LTPHRDDKAHTGLVYRAGSWEIDPTRRELRADGRTALIGARAFEIIQVLAEASGELITKDDLMMRVWPGAIVGENTLQVHISAIRKALGQDRAMLKTTASRGYRLLGHWTARRAALHSDGQDSVPSPAAPVRGNLPATTTDLIGRGAVVRGIRDLMSAYRVVTLTGPGGIGKTRLALEIARLVSPEFNGDVWLVELASLSDPGLVTAAVDGALGLHVGGNEISPAALARAIGGRKLLLVIDNCEHVIDAAAGAVDTVIRLCPGASVLLTSRELLRVEGECTYRVPPLAFPARDAVERGQEQTLEASAIQLFIARMTASQAGLEYRHELSAIAAICRRLDGIPLAIEFAAARAATLGVESVLTRLDDRFGLLTGGRRTALPKHQTLRATLDWSYELLSDPERLLLQRLAIFAAAFSLEAAGAVTGTSDVPAAKIADGIANLVAKSLVIADLTGAVTYFRLLETTRAYALEKLTDSGASQQFARRHAEYHRDLLERIESEQELKPANPADLGNVRAALEWSFGVNGDIEIGIGLAAAAAPVFLAMSLLIECHRWSERALLALEDVDRGGQKEMHLQAALGLSLMFTRGNSEVVRVALNRSLSIAEERRDTLNQLQILGRLHIFHERMGDFETALQLAKRASIVSRAIGEPAMVEVGHAILGISLHLIGDQRGARAELEAVIRHRPDVPRTSTINLGFDHHNRACIALARTLWLQGQSTRAMQLARRTIDEAALMEHPVTLCIALIWGVSVFFWTGDLESAEENINRFIAHADSHSLGPYLQVGLGVKAELAIRRGNARAGVEDLQACLRELHAARYELLTTTFNISLVQGLAATDRTAEAMTLIDETIHLVETNGDLFFMPELLRVKGGLLLSMPSSNGDDAKMYFMRSMELSRRQASPAWELRTAVDLATLLAARERPESGRALLLPVFEQFREGLDTADLRAAARLLATL